MEKLGLYGAFAIVLLIVWNTNILFQLVKEEERNKMELWATAQKELVESNDLSRDFGALAFDVLQKIGVAPMIQVNEAGKIVDFKNIAWSAKEDPDSLQLYAVLEEIKLQNAPIPIVYSDIINQKLYYGDAPLLVKLRYYPLALLLILLLFGGLLYFFFQTNKAAEQNRLWAGMAKRDRTPNWNAFEFPHGLDCLVERTGNRAGLCRRNAKRHRATGSHYRTFFQSWLPPRFGRRRYRCLDTIDH